MSEPETLGEVINSIIAASDSSLERAFFCTCADFSTAAEVLGHLQRRFTASMSEGRTKAVDNSSARRKRIVCMLTSWVQILRRELQAEELEKLSAFVGVIEMSGMSSEAEVLRRLMGDNTPALAPVDTARVATLLGNPTVLPSTAPAAGANALLKLDHAEIARQITLQMSELHRAIRSFNLLSSRWKRGPEDAAGAFVAYSEKLSRWVETELCCTYDRELLQRVAKKLLKVANYLLSTHNIQGASDMFNAFLGPSVAALNLDLPNAPKLRKLYASLADYFSSSWMAAGVAPEHLQPPYIPLFGPLLERLATVDDSGPGIINGKIIFKKYSAMGSTIASALRGAAQPYTYPLHNAIQAYLCSTPVLSRQQLSLGVNRKGSVAASASLSHSTDSSISARSSTSSVGRASKINGSAASLASSASAVTPQSPTPPPGAPTEPIEKLPDAVALIAVLREQLAEERRKSAALQKALGEIARIANTSV